MHDPVRRPRTVRMATALAIALSAVLVAGLPAAAFHASFTKPKLIFGASYAPNHALAVDGSGKAHVAVQGSGGIWYLTNESGSWTQCQVSDGDDRQPSIAVSGAVVHVAFTRQTDLQQGVWTASSDQPSAGPGCSWEVTRRYAGSARDASLEAYGSTLSIAFRTGPKKLKFIRGSAGVTPWTVNETIDSDCCTSPVELELTTGGAPRVVYGDGTSKANGLKYAVRGSGGWKKTKVQGGRIKHVDLALDKSPGIYNPPPNSPKIIYVVKGKGTYTAKKGGSGVGGSWTREFHRRTYGPPQIYHSANNTQLIYGGGGKLWLKTWRVIVYEEVLSGSGRDVKPRFDADHITFSRNKGTRGVYYSRRK